MVISIISLLVSILLPSLAKAKALAREATCLTRISGQVKAVHIYAVEHNSAIPVGPTTIMPYPPVAYRDLASNQIVISITSRTYNAHGELMEKELLLPGMMFCPDDDSRDALDELEEAQHMKKLEEGDDTIYCSYLYRQLDEVGSGKATLDDLGKNSLGVHVSALIMDANSRLPGYPERFNHRGERINIAFVDGSANTFEQHDENFFLHAGDAGKIPARMDEILQAADDLRK